MRYIFLLLISIITLQVRAESAEIYYGMKQQELVQFANSSMANIYNVKINKDTPARIKDYIIGDFYLETAPGIFSNEINSLSNCSIKQPNESAITASCPSSVFGTASNITLVLARKAADDVNLRLIFIGLELKNPDIDVVMNAVTSRWGNPTSQPVKTRTSNKSDDICKKLKMSNKTRNECSNSVQNSALGQLIENTSSDDDAYKFTHKKDQLELSIKRTKVFNAENVVVSILINNSEVEMLLDGINTKKEQVISEVKKFNDQQKTKDF